MARKVVFADELEVGNWTRVGDSLLSRLHPNDPFKRIIEIRSFPDGEVLNLKLEDLDGNQEIKLVNKLLAMEVPDGMHIAEDELSHITGEERG